jgi:competence protein ComEA
MLDLIQACGGVSETADINKINRAAILKDGEKIEVPSLPSAKNTSAYNPTPQSQQKPKNSPPKQSSQSTNYQSSTPIPSQTNGQQKEQLTSNQPTPISINTATQAMIETLPGVGPSLAKRIIDYREGIGGFTSINELSQVRGVGPSLLEKIRPLITL